MIPIFLFIIGLAIGSFLNVLIDRLPKNQSIGGRSHCDHCRHRLAWYDLLPVVSFFLIGGQCRYCGKKISFYYPLVELITGAMFVFTISVIPTGQLAGRNLDPSSAFGGLRMIIALGIISCLIVIFFADLKYQIIPDEILLVLLVFSLPFFVGGGIFNHLLASILFSAFIFLIYFFTKGKGMGFGDVKFAFVIGFFQGLKIGAISIYLAFVIGAIVGLLLLIVGRKKMKSRIAFGPFLVLGIIITIFFNKEIFAILAKLY